MKTWTTIIILVVALVWTTVTFSAPWWIIPVGVVWFCFLIVLMDGDGGGSLGGDGGGF